MAGKENVLLVSFAFLSFHVSASSGAFNSAVVAGLVGRGLPCILSLCPYTAGTS